MADDDDDGGFQTIHPPSMVHFNQDARPPSPLSSAPNTPLRFLLPIQNNSSSVEAPLDLDLPPLAPPVAPTNTLCPTTSGNRKGDTPFDETDEEKSPKNNPSLGFKSRSSSGVTETFTALKPIASSPRLLSGKPPTSPTKVSKMKTAASPQVTLTKSSTSPKVTVKKSTTPPQITPTKPTMDPLVPRGTPSTLRMMALLQNEQAKSPTSPTSQNSPTIPDMKTTRQFDKTFVPTIVAPDANTIDVPEDEQSPRKPMRLDVPHDESPTKSPKNSGREPPLPNQVAHRGIPISTVIEIKDDDSYTREFQPPAKPQKRKKSVMSFFPTNAVLFRDQASYEDTTLTSEDDDHGEEGEADVIDLMMSDAAYYSKAAAEISFSFTSVLADAGAAMEELVLGPPKVAKTPEQLAAEWRRRKRIVVQESKTQATRSAAVASELEELGEEVEVSSKGVPVGEEDDDDDRTALADNRVRSDMDDSQEEASAGNSLVGIVVGGATVDQPSSASSRKSSSVISNGLDSVTGWWLEKEVLRHGHKSSSIQSASSTDSPAPSSVSIRSIDDVSAITDDSAQKRRQIKKKAVAAAVDLAITSSAAPTLNDKGPALAGRPPLSMKKNDIMETPLKAGPPVETKTSALSPNRRKQKRPLILPAKEEPFILNKKLTEEKKEMKNDYLVPKELNSPKVAVAIIATATSATIHSMAQVDGLGHGVALSSDNSGPGDYGDLPSLSKSNPEEGVARAVEPPATTMSKTTEEEQLEECSEIGVLVVGLASAVDVVDLQSFGDLQGSISKSPLDEASHAEMDPTAAQDTTDKSEEETSSKVSALLVAHTASTELADCSMSPVDSSGDVLALLPNELTEPKITTKNAPVQLGAPTEESGPTPPRESTENGDQDICSKSSPPLVSLADEVGVTAIAPSAVTLSSTPMVDGPSEALSNDWTAPSEYSDLSSTSTTSPINAFAAVMVPTEELEAVPSPLEETTTEELEEPTESGEFDKHPKTCTQVVALDAVAAAATTVAVSKKSRVITSGDVNALAAATDLPLSTAPGNLPRTPTNAETDESACASTGEIEPTPSPIAETAEVEGTEEEQPGENITTSDEERDDRTNWPHLAAGAIGMMSVACTLTPMLRNDTHAVDTQTAWLRKSGEVHALTDLPEKDDETGQYAEYEVEDDTVEDEDEHVEVDRTDEENFSVDDEEEGGDPPVYPSSDDYSVSFTEVASVPDQTTGTVESCSSDVTQVRSNETPVLIMSIDDINGVAKGDAVISLVKTSTGTTCRGQVNNAVWRMRMMRRRMISTEQGKSSKEEDQIPGSTYESPLRKRSSLPVDVDDVRVVGGIRNIETLQAQAIEHLKFDEIEEAQELYEDIIYAYTETFKERVKNKPNSTVVSQREEAALDFRAYIGTALHNLGLLHFLTGEFEDALSFFMRARDSRKGLLGVSHVDYLTSYTKVALCHYALEDFDAAHAEFETALGLGKRNCQGLTDFIQIAEILNNLGVLTFMCGDPDASLNHFKESLQVQHAMLSHSLYGGSSIMGHGITLNISVTRANIGFVKLVSKDFPAAMIAFESALMHQQMLLGDSHETLIGTMDHLAVINSLLGNKDKALKMLSRMFQAQQEAHGAGDPRCIATMSKLRLIGDKEKNLVAAVDRMAKTHAPQGKEVDGPINLIEQSLASKLRLEPVSPARSPVKGSPVQSKPKSVLKRFISKRKPKDEVTQPIGPEPCRIEI